MRVPVLSTLSGRIIVGFAVLVLTYGGVSALTVHNMDILSREIRLMRIGYAQLTLISKDLSEKQTDLRSYLHQDLGGEASEARVRAKLSKFRGARNELITDAIAVLDELDKTGVERRHFNVTRMRLERIHDDVGRLTPLYLKVQANPPLDRTRGDAPSEERLEAERALEQLRTREVILQARIFDLARNQKRVFDDRTHTLEDAGQQLRRYTFVFGAIAVFLGMLVTAWASLTLRPIRRLRDAARQIAAGDYASRIAERGPAEVADLAHEFNVMGRAIEERERELVRSERLVAVGKMAAMITHEVRNPLSSIGLNTELLEEELGELPSDQVSEARSLCRAITREVDRLTAITEEYLQFARLPKPKLQSESVERIIRGLAEFEREQLALRGITLEVDIEDGLPPVMVDEGQLRQSLLNLVRNAADAVEEVGGGRVQLSARTSNDMLEVRVHDDGTGISEELQGKLFEPFFSTKDGGTGLGLALTHQIVREHGGDITVDSRPGHGATFLLTLPLSPDRDGARK